MDALTPLQSNGLWALAGTFTLLFVFLGLRGRVPIDRGWGGMTMQRFSTFERALHWLLALSFLILAATGFAQFYGAPLLSLVGTKPLAIEFEIGRPLHAAAGATFSIALAVTFLLRIAHSFPSWRDAVWIAKGGGMFLKNTTPPAWKFNAAQKMLFWLVVLGGTGLALTGFALLFPHRTALVPKTVAALTAMGVHLPVDAANLTPEREASYARLWHGVLALGLACVVMVHIYLRTIGIRGAVSAMTSGQVDVNLARQQHSLWAERELKRMEGEAFGKVETTRAAPAE
jgi:formate dehydrogenase subunit gamma